MTDRDEGRTGEEDAKVIARWAYERGLSAEDAATLMDQLARLRRAERSGDVGEEHGDTRIIEGRGLDYDPRSNVEPDPYTFDQYVKRAESGEDDWHTMLNAISAAHCFACGPCDYEGIRLAAFWALARLRRTPEVDAMCCVTGGVACTRDAPCDCCEARRTPETEPVAWMIEWSDGAVSLVRKERESSEHAKVTPLVPLATQDPNAVDCSDGRACLDHQACSARGSCMIDHPQDPNAGEDE